MAGRTGDVPIRVLVDGFHDATRADPVLDLAAAGVTLTLSRRRLTAAALRHHDVLIVRTHSPKRFTPAELRAVEEFVSAGGGLLLASSAPRFELATGRPACEMPAQDVAAVFGCRFLSADECAGKPRLDRHFRVGFSREDVAGADGAPEGFGPHPPDVGAWLPVEAPEKSAPLLVHRRTRQPLATLAAHGKGRVCVAGEPFLCVSAKCHLAPLVQWLAGDAPQRPGRAVPETLGPAPQHRCFAGIDVHYDATAEDVLDETLAIVFRAREQVLAVLGDRPLPDRCTVVDGCLQTEGWWSKGRIGCRGEPWTIAWDTAFNCITYLAERSQVGEMCVSLFPEGTLMRFLAIEVLRRMGYEAQADRLHQMALSLYDEDNPEHTDCDLARVYWATEKWRPKGYWALDKLVKRFGTGLFKRFFEALPDEMPIKDLPAHTWYSDKMIYYLSLAAGEDLFGWFAEIGTTVHPIPIIKPEDKRAKSAFDECAVEAASAGSASERMDAIGALTWLEDKERSKLPRCVRELVDGVRMADNGDARAVEVLGRVMKRKPDSQNAALAALQLAALGDPEACRRLPGLAAGEDTRFRLWAGYALSKATCGDADLALSTVGDEDVQLYKDLEIHARVEGYEVANVVSATGWCQFPHGNLASRFFVFWVHTSPQWRRMGLSRELFAKAMAHPQAQGCSTFALHTGTRNVAHRMYAEFGFVDMKRDAKHTKLLTTGGHCPPPDGVMVRAMKDGEEERVRGLIAEVIAAGCSDWPCAVPELGARDRTVTAWEGEKLVGVAVGSASASGEGRLRAVCVPHNHQQAGAVGAAMLTALHARLSEDGATKTELRADPAHKFWSEVLGLAGYSAAPSGAVTMLGIRDLGQLFDEISPLYEKRMREGKRPDWQGRVTLVGERLRAGLEIDAGEVAVLTGKPGRGDVVVTAPDWVITRVVTGRETPMEGYLQTHTRIDPRPSPGVMQVLETLFPQTPWIGSEPLG